MKNDPKSYPLNLNSIFPFALDRFQKEAIAALEQGKSVVVCAPTGSGKTVIGEYIIHRALACGKRVFYTTPLKALSNQKFRDFQELFAISSPLAVGLITGDMVINPDAAVVVMTTEIFRNMLYETPIGEVGTSLENVESVVLDECHYISDRGRGTVWEESIIYCPPNIQLVALSATVGNPEELTDWINKARLASQFRDNISLCELVNSNYRPVPLRFYFAKKEDIFPLLDNKQTKLNPHLKDKGDNPKKRRLRREDCPSIAQVVQRLQEKDMLPAIYVIFSRRGCDQAMQQVSHLNLVKDEESKSLYYYLLEFFLSENVPLQSALISFLALQAPKLHDKFVRLFANEVNAEIEVLQYLIDNQAIKRSVFEFLANFSHLVRLEQLEPLTRGIAAHHAGVLPLWKELVEKLFEMGLVKVVFATATLSAGINMPARTTVISALSKRTDDGHSMLTPSEFVQIAGRAGRRGMDEVGHVVTLQTPFEGAKEAAFLAISKPEPLQSCFTPSYGMVLNLLQKHTLEQSKDLLERSFAEYLAQLKLTPDKQAIAQLTTELAKLDVELAGIDPDQVKSYEKLKERQKEGERLLKLLQNQAEITRKQQIAPQLTHLIPGKILHLKGKHIKVHEPIRGLFLGFMPGSGQSPDLLCLGEDNRWYIATYADVADINPKSLFTQEVEHLTLPEVPPKILGSWHKGDDITLVLSRAIREQAEEISPPFELGQQQQKIEQVLTLIAAHPLSAYKNVGRIIKLCHQRQNLRDQLHRTQIKYQKQQSQKSYYWQEFLDLIEILREFQALEGYNPTVLGRAAAIIRGENELWLALVLMSGQLDDLEPPALAAVISAIITEPPRPDSWSNYTSPPEIVEIFQQATSEPVSLREIRRLLYQAQSRHGITIPVWLETQFMGLVAAWTRGCDWQELCENTNLDEGDLVRLFRRTVDILWQIPQIPSLSPRLQNHAREAIIGMKRFPL